MPRSPLREEREEREERDRNNRDSNKRMRTNYSSSSAPRDGLKREREPERDRERQRREPRERDTKRERDGTRENKRRREEDERDTHRDNRPRYFQATNPNVPRALLEKEVDEKKLSTRQKQIDFGKNTIGYQRYLEGLPKTQRKKTDIWTPEKTYKCSKRSWDGQVRQWRRLLHEYDPPAAEGEIEIDLENEEDDLSRLQQELDDERNAENKENDKAETNKTKPETIKSEKVEAKQEVKTESAPSWKTVLPFMEPLENEKWADMV